MSKTLNEYVELIDYIYFIMNFHLSRLMLLVLNINKLMPQFCICFKVTFLTYL